MPAQFTGTNGALLRSLDSKIARATTSLPTPLSPVINTLASERETRTTSASSSRIAWLVPIKCRPFVAGRAHLTVSVGLDDTDRPPEAAKKPPARPRARVELSNSLKQAEI